MSRSTSLAIAGVDLRIQRWATRRSRLEQLAAGWLSPLQLTPVTYDADEAQEWFEVLPAAMGVEGLVLNPPPPGTLVAAVPAGQR